MAPSGKTCMVLRGYQYTDFLFLKNTDTDSPFPYVEKKLEFHVVDTSILQKMV